jgi:hypothetical protein
MLLLDEKSFAAPQLLIALAVISALILATIARIVLYRHHDVKSEDESVKRVAAPLSVHPDQRNQDRRNLLNQL